MPSSIKQAFNQAAHTYNTAASAQHAAGAHLIQCLPNNTFSHVLDLGCGTGLTTRALADTLHYKNLIALDIADMALTLAASECEAYPIHFIEADFNQWETPEQFDLIFSNMALHWSDDLEKTLRQCHHHLYDHGLLAFSLPLSHTFHELNGFTRKRSLPHLEIIQNLLIETKFELCYQEINFSQTSHQNTLACLRAIKQTGATAADHCSHSSLTKKSLHEHNITCLTYEIGFFIGKKKC